MDAEVIIVGGGIVGLWTLYELTQQGIKGLLFEQVCNAFKDVLVKQVMTLWHLAINCLVICQDF